MKKNLFIASVFLFTISLFIGCSSNDSDNNDIANSGNLFLKINISGTEYNDTEGGFYGFSDRANCNNNGDLFLQSVGQIETSKIFVQCFFLHFENNIDFSDKTKNIATNSGITDKNEVYPGNDVDVCGLNNDFSIIFEDKVSNKYLSFKPNTTKKHTITKVTQVSEDTTSRDLIVEGNFEAVFLNGNTEIPVKGSYRTEIEVLK
ncbi:hypothetical protein [Flavobacterium sp. 5]|uniref:hypothetical protein n=1 Tax=Flavobacterium sp. 5 TaxID=2035199 RepID=UPI000C2B85CA|nr:hypothetical protein [Flavobacterium sp. 5]PKB15487.1 hypothetical protein CLU82_0564 [Flavobacterium sp. 5]